jgi:hypothetical protein
MKIDGLEWMDWLRKIRGESEEERQRLGLSYAERLARAEQVADAVIAELASEPPVVRDEPATKPPCKRRGRRPSRH